MQRHERMGNTMVFVFQKYVMNGAFNILIYLVDTQRHMNAFVNDHASRILENIWKTLRTSSCITQEIYGFLK